MDLWIVVEKNDVGEIISYFNQEKRNVDAVGTLPDIDQATVFDSRSNAKIAMGRMTAEQSDREFEIVKVVRKITIVE